jgi:hypothetical protein
MATYERREVHTVTVEFRVPAQRPYGACWPEVLKAVDAAIRDLRDAGVIAEDAVPPDDQIRIHARDEEIVVTYESEAA